MTKWLCAFRGGTGMCAALLTTRKTAGSFPGRGEGGPFAATFRAQLGKKKKENEIRIPI